MSKPRRPQIHPYDAARIELKEAGGGLFTTIMNTPMRAGQRLGPWKGDEVTAFRFSPLRGLTHKHYTVHFTSKVSGNALWFVNLEGDTTQEERNRLAEVFMDLINTQRIDN
jgi:hypothetical protein